MVTVISCSLWRHFYWESITLSVEDAIYERVECGKSEKGSVLLGRKQRWMWQSKAGLKKKKEERKKEAAFSIKDIGRGYILWWYLCTDHPDSISLNYDDLFSTCVHFLHTLPQRSFFFFFYRFFFFWQNFCSWRKLRKSHQCVEIILLQSQMIPGSELAHQSVKSLWKHQNTQQRVSDRETVKSLLFQFKKKISESSLYPTLISENEMLVPDLSASCSLIIII